MYNLIAIFCILSFFLLFLVAITSYKFNLLDVPNKRKNHANPTAYTGGIALSLIYIFSILLFDITGRNLNLILSISFLIAIVGFIDDKYHLSVGSKLGLQIIPIFYLIIFENLGLSQLGDYGFFKIKLGTFSIPFTLLSVLFLINAFNYFDGTDGTLGFTTISTLAILYFLISDENIRLFFVIISIPICIFLFFNFSFFKLPKLFMGDSGSLLLGFIISFLSIYLVNKNIIHPILIAWSIQIFVYEFISINLIRLKNKKKLFKAGQDHLHHLLIKKTKSIFLTNFFISISNIILFIIGYTSFKFISSIASLMLFIAFFIIFFILRIKYSN